MGGTAKKVSAWIAQLLGIRRFDNLGTADHEMCAFKPATGETVWSLKTRRSVKYAPAIDEERGLIAFASFDSSIYAVDAATGTKLGEWETGEICYTTPLIVGNRLFCGSGDRHLYIIDLEKMELIKKIDFRARIYSVAAYHR